MIKHDDLYLKEDVSLVFLELNFSFIYIKELDILFAYSTLQLPTKEYPYIEFKGFNVNKYRENTEYTQMLQTEITKRIDMPFKEYQFSSNFKWFIIKDEMTTERLKRLANLKRR